MALFPEVAVLFESNRIYIPKRVRDEFNKAPKSRKMLARIMGEQAIFMRCNTADEVSVRVLLAELAPRRTKPRGHEGEAEAVIQAARIGASAVIIDDRRARKWQNTVAYSVMERRGSCARSGLWISYRRFGPR